MVSNYLLPNKYKKVGWFLLIPSLVLGFLFTIGIEYNINTTVFAFWFDDIMEDLVLFSFIKENIYNEIIGICLLISLALVAFSKEKNEDEYISRVRLDSLLWATYINYGLLFLAIIFIYGIPFQTIMIYNMFTILLIFIIRFNIVLFITKRQMENEK